MPGLSALSTLSCWTLVHPPMARCCSWLTWKGAWEINHFQMDSDVLFKRVPGVPGPELSGRAVTEGPPLGPSDLFREK